jgi:hypothetical protein
MDVAAAGQASAQISAGQRAQQLAISGLRSSQLQAQSIASVLAQSAQATKASNTAQPPAQPAQGGNGGDTGGGSQASSSAGQARGSLVNILV